MPLAKQTLCTVSDHFAEPSNCLGSRFLLELLEENQSLVSLPPLVCGHLEDVYLEKNNSLFYSCWRWKTLCPPERGVIGISGRRIVTFSRGVCVFVLVCRCLCMPVLHFNPGVLFLLRASLLLKSFFYFTEEKIEIEPYCLKHSNTQFLNISSTFWHMRQSANL